jgi:hypothetical protein
MFGEPKMEPAMIRALTLASFALAAATPALAASDVPLAPFHGLELNGGGDVVLKHGPVQKVTMLSGDLRYTTFTVKDGSLTIDACNSWHCPWHYDLRVEIVTPQLTAISVHGGGDLKTEGSFPQQNALAVSVHGGGDVDLRAIPAVSVAADVHGGGDLKTTATHSLTASVHGGGDLTYWGNPPQLVVSTNGGGDISRGD